MKSQMSEWCVITHTGWLSFQTGAFINFFCPYMKRFLLRGSSCHLMSLSAGKLLFREANSPLTGIELTSVA